MWDPLEADGPCRGFISTVTVRVILLPGYHPTHQLRRTVFYSKTFAGVSVNSAYKTASKTAKYHMKRGHYFISLLSVRFNTEWITRCLSSEIAIRIC